jgi:hypothetical protein
MFTKKGWATWLGLFHIILTPKHSKLPETGFFCKFST